MLIGCGGGGDCHGNIGGSGDVMAMITMVIIVMGQPLQEKRSTLDR